jgi:DNA-binding GntR family transcriptional regulator
MIKNHNTRKTTVSGMEDTFGLGENLSGLAAVARQPLHDRVFQEMRRAIMQANFHPGAEINLKSLALAMGTSEMPVRDAVRRLMAAHAIEMMPNRRIRIPNPSADEYAEILRLRLTLESEATLAACDNLSEETLRELAEIHRLLARASVTGITPKSLELNWQFHFRIYSAAKMPILMAFIESLWLRNGPIFNLQPADLPKRRKKDFHGLALKALESRDATEAAQAIRNDISTTGDLILAELRQREAVQLPTKKRRRTA